MNKTAYLVMLIRVDGKRPRYAGLGVYSEPYPTGAVVDPLLDEYKSVLAVANVR